MTMHPSRLERVFVQLTYEEIAHLFAYLGISFASPINQIPKLHLFATIVHDFSNNVIAEAISEATIN